ncbi:MAG: hypothetical protein SGPRY_009908 [Prymnesium sp.]
MDAVYVEQFDLGQGGLHVRNSGHLLLGNRREASDVRDRGHLGAALLDILLHQERKLRVSTYNPEAELLTDVKSMKYRMSKGFLAMEDLSLRHEDCAKGFEALTLWVERDMSEASPIRDEAVLPVVKLNLRSGKVERHGGEGGGERGEAREGSEMRSSFRQLVSSSFHQLLVFSNNQNYIR